MADVSKYIKRAEENKPHYYVGIGYEIQDLKWASVKREQSNYPRHKIRQDSECGQEDPHFKHFNQQAKKYSVSNNCQTEFVFQPFHTVLPPAVFLVPIEPTPFIC